MQLYCIHVSLHSLLAALDRKHGFKALWYSACVPLLKVGLDALGEIEYLDRQMAAHAPRLKSGLTDWMNEWLACLLDNRLID